MASSQVQTQQMLQQGPQTDNLVPIGPPLDGTLSAILLSGHTEAFRAYTYFKGTKTAGHNLPYSKWST